MYNYKLMMTVIFCWSNKFQLIQGHPSTNSSRNHFHEFLFSTLTIQYAIGNISSFSFQPLGID